MKRFRFAGFVFIGALISLVCAVVGAAVLALFAKDVQVQNTLVSIIAVAIKIIAVAAGVLFACIKIRKKGWIVGITVSLLFWVLLYFSSFLLGSGEPFDITAVYDCALTVAIGTFSGILLVNTIK